MSHGKQFTLFSHDHGPNGWKIVTVFEELGLTYKTKYLDFSKNEQKSEALTKYNPNGRVPVIIDHYNNDFVIWESGAIITYLVDKYDTEHKISVADPNEKYKQLQWLFFQASGQGPYFGQYVWFLLYHPGEKIPSAIERYKAEVKRVWGVLNDVLSKQDWLVGDKLTVADLALFIWNNGTIGLLKDEYDIAKEVPAFAAWHAKLLERPSIKKVLDDRKKLEEAKGH